MMISISKIYKFKMEIKNYYYIILKQSLTQTRGWNQLIRPILCDRRVYEHSPPLLQTVR